MLKLIDRWEKYNYIQLTKNKMDLNNRKRKIIHHPPSEGSHPMTDLLGKIVEETGDEFISTKSKYNNNKHNILRFYEKRES